MVDVKHTAHGWPRQLRSLERSSRVVSFPPRAAAVAAATANFSSAAVAAPFALPLPRTGPRAPFAPSSPLPFSVHRNRRRSSHFPEEATAAAAASFLRVQQLCRHHRSLPPQVACDRARRGVGAGGRRRLFGAFRRLRVRWLVALYRRSLRRLRAYYTKAVQDLLEGATAMSTLHS
uniref:Uncharacterized protein n=1 Tax=Oryza glumipatula TaxID=40148 RepID=A0A0D9YQR3_9ORYZ